MVSIMRFAYSHFIGGYLLFALIFGPYLKNIHGIGSNSVARKARSEVAQPIPSASYTVI
jgi:hypothetical protein